MIYTPLNLESPMIADQSIWRQGLIFQNEDYKKLSAKRIANELVEIRERLVELEAKANAIIKTIHPFNFPVFEEKFKQKTYNGTCVETLYNEYIDKLAAQSRRNCR